MHALYVYIIVLYIKLFLIQTTLHFKSLFILVCVIMYVSCVLAV